VVDTGATPWQLRDCERIIAGNAELLAQKHFLIGITRVRNEALILGDTLEFVGRHVDAIIAYDDASTDRTLELLRRHPKVALILANRTWETDVRARRTAEYRHRQLLLKCAREHLRFEWMLCFDADERITGDLRGVVSGPLAAGYDGVRVQLFDAYMTPDDCAPYQSDQELLGFRRYYGPEQRDILMLWRNRPEVFFAKGHEREPGGISRLCTDLYCQHYTNLCRSNTGRRPATTTSSIFHSKPTARNGSPAKGGRSTPNPISCGRSMNGAMPCLRTLSKLDPVGSGSGCRPASGWKSRGVNLRRHEGYARYSSDLQ
jgi:Glycosyl transferase family 2